MLWTKPSTTLRIHYENGPNVNPRGLTSFICICLSISKMPTCTNIVALPITVICLALTCLSCNQKSQESDSSDRGHVNARASDKGELLDIPVPELANYSGDMTVVIAVSTNLNKDTLYVAFKGHGLCRLKVMGAYSDAGKSAIGFEITDSVLEFDLSRIDGPFESFVLHPDNNQNYDAVVSYPVPSSLVGKFSEAVATCLVMPLGEDGEMCYEPILISSRKTQPGAAPQNGASD